MGFDGGLTVTVLVLLGQGACPARGDTDGGALEPAVGAVVAGLEGDAAVHGEVVVDDQDLAGAQAHGARDAGEFGRQTLVGGPVGGGRVVERGVGRVEAEGEAVLGVEERGHAGRLPAVVICASV